MMLCRACVCICHLVRRGTLPLALVAGVVGALGVVPGKALAVSVAGTSSTLESFRQTIIADYDFETFVGSAGLVALPPIVGAGGFSYSVVSSSNVTVVRSAIGICSNQNDQGLVFNFTGRPTSAFGGTFRMANLQIAPTPMDGNLVVQTNTGLSFPVSVGAGGTFFGFTSTEPFTSVTIADAAGNRFEFVDDVYVGSAVTATDGCGDARTISPGGAMAAVYPFATGGNTAEAISGVCDGAIDTGPDVWYRFVAPVHGSATVGTCGSTHDSILRVFSSCPVGGSGAGQIACNDDACAGGGIDQSRGSQVTFRVAAGEDYLIRVSGYDGASGLGNLNISVVPDCVSDFNHTGVRDVTDIFAFLTAWFGGCP